MGLRLIAVTLNSYEPASSGMPGRPNCVVLGVKDNEWFLADQNTRTTTTWLEIMIHFELTGARTDCAKEGQRHALEEALKKKNGIAQRW